MKRKMTTNGTMGTRPAPLIKNKVFLRCFAVTAITLACLLQSLPGHTQYIEFIENKGQWDSSIQYKGTYSAGAIALKPDGGYRVLLHNREDLKAVSALIHGEKVPGSTNVTGKKITTGGASAADGNGVLFRSHVYQASFLHANPHPVAVPEKRQDKYNNYFLGNDPTKWASKCGVFNAVTFKNVYPGIDVHYYTSGGNFKYDIVVNKGADVSKVALKIDGAEGLSVTNGNLVVKTSVDEVKELAPYSYTATAQGNKALKCRYNLRGNILTFKFADAIKPGTALVIDPTLIFCSFSGSKVDNWGYTATYDYQGNFYAGGIVFGTGFPVSTGAYQTVFKGGNNNTGEGDDRRGIDVLGFDIGIMKFNSTGTTAVYATYIGGKSGNEQPHSLVADGSGNLIIAGRTTSTSGVTANDYPTLGPGTIGTGGGQDIVLTKLSADGGSLIGSLRIGGTGDDGVNIRTKDLSPAGTESIRRNYGDDARSEVILDKAGNICLASCTQSTDFPLQNALFTTLGGNQDAVLLKFAPALNSTPIFSTYLGGSGNDAAFVVAQNPVTLNLYVAGATASSNFPGVSGTAGTPLSGRFIGGDCDGFVSEFTNNGSSLIKSVYFGTASADQLYGIDFNESGNPYIMGTTEGVVTPVNSPFNANGNQAAGKQFITKLTADLTSVVYSANFGPGNGQYPNISPTAFLVDNCENVYVSGWGAGLDSAEGYANSGLAGLSYVNTGAAVNQLSSSLKGIGNFYFFVMKKDAASQLFGAFLGDASDYDGVHVDGGTSRFDKSGVIYQAICACGPDRSLATSGVAYPTSGAYNQPVPGYGCNLTSLKIAFNFAGVRAGVKASIKASSNDTSGCVPLTITFTDTVANGKKYILNFGDGSAPVTTTNTIISHTYNNIGTYKVMEVAIDSSTCNIADTAYVTIRVRDDPATIGFSFTKLQPCDSFHYVFTNTSVPSAGKSFNDSSFTWNFGDGTTLVTGLYDVNHYFASAGTYTVKLTLTDTAFCNAPLADSVQIKISAVFAAAFTTPSSGCVPYTAAFNNNSVGGQSFLWNFGDGTTSTQTAPTHLYTVPGTYTVTLSGVDSSTCNITDTTSTTIRVYAQPTAVFTYSPQQPVANTPVTFTNQSTGAIRYIWSFGDGTTFATSSDTAVSHLYIKSGTYTVCLRAYNISGCVDSVCQQVPTIIIPLLDVPKALSANGDNHNDQVYVQGFGIEKMDWKIYNRWGTLVFESTSQSIGWDGRYKGVLQPQDVYVYVLDVQFGDGTTYQKKGDITLLR
jgi:gliding motility-associated-like protein